jgi:flagellar protein FliS
MNTAALSAYRQNSIDTASPARLIVMLYDGLVSAIDKAGAALETSPMDIELAHTELTRCQDIVVELMQSLNHDAGEMAVRLATLYEYCHHQLVRANATKDMGHAEPVRAIFSDLRDAWIEITESVPTERVSA